MQDRIRQIDETSCTARPDHTFGSEGEELSVSKCGPVNNSKAGFGGSIRGGRRWANSGQLHPFRIDALLR